MLSFCSVFNAKAFVFICIYAIFFEILGSEISV